MWPCVCLRIMTRYYSYAILDYMCTKSTKSKHVGVARLGPDTRVPCYLKKRTVHGLKKERALEIMCHFIHSRTLWEEGKANRTRPNWICCTEWLIIVLSKGSGCLYCQGNEADSFFGWNVFIYLFIVQNNLDLIALFFLDAHAHRDVGRQNYNSARREYIDTWTDNCKYHDYPIVEPNSEKETARGDAFVHI